MSVMLSSPTDIYTLSLHDALPISGDQCVVELGRCTGGRTFRRPHLQMRHSPGLKTRPTYVHFVQELHEMDVRRPDRKSTRLNSSHTVISYAVFCLKKKNTHTTRMI